VTALSDSRLLTPAPAENMSNDNLTLVPWSRVTKTCIFKHWEKAFRLDLRHSDDGIVFLGLGGGTGFEL
jgi:hypothetical protein